MAVLASVAVPSRGGSGRSWTLSTPLVGLLLGIVNEAGATPGWRCDRIFLLPGYGLILAGWLVRLVPLLRA